MSTHDISLTCKAAFEAFEQSECCQLQAELDWCTDAAAKTQLEITELQNDVQYLYDTCRLLCTRLV